MSANPCIRCGNERILSKTWKEVITVYGGLSTIIHTEFTCPDNFCQKTVEKQLLAQKEKRVFSQHQKEIEKQIRLKNLKRLKSRS